MNFKNEIPIIFVLTPPVWEKLPPLGQALLTEYLKMNNINSLIYDLNIIIYHKLPEKFKKDWTINKNYTEKSFFDFCYKNFYEDFYKLLKIINEHKIKFAGFTVYKSNREFCLQTAQFLKNYNNNLKIIFGGPEVFSMMLENFANLNYIDYFVVGEGEMAILEILKNSNNKIIKFLQLNDINFFPKYEKFELLLYTRKNSLPIITSRGCINKCNFCFERLLFKGFRTREPENIIDEILFHYKRNNIRWFTFYDSIFNANLNLIDNLMNLILKNDIKIFWDAQISIRKDMEISLLKKMKKAGCINLFIGLESASQKILNLMNKNFTINDAVAFFEKLNKAELQFEISLIVNYPGETDDDFNETLNFIRNNKNLIKKIAQINNFKKYPGTNVEIPLNYDEKIGEIRINKLLQVIKESNIKFTKSFINNLI